MKKLVALLCAALFFILPMTAYASDASTPTRVPDIGEAVTAYTKDDYILDFSSAMFSVMDANGAEQNGGVYGLNNVMKIWVHTADNQTFTAYCLDTGVVSGSTTISNEKIKSSVTLKKVDEQGKPLEGATIKALDASGKEVFSGRTDKDGKVTVSGLSLNTAYTYFESAAPAGYELNSTKYTFTVDGAGNMSKPADIVNKRIAAPTPTPTSAPPVIIPNKPVLLPPATGDRGSGGIIGVCMMAAAVCVGAVVWYRHRQKGAA